MSAWSSVAQTAPGSSIFHDVGWLKAYEEGAGREPRHILVYKNRNLLAVFPNFIEPIGSSSLRRLDSVRPGYGGPLILANEPEVLKLLQAEVAKVCGGGLVSHRIMSTNSFYLRYARYWKDAGYGVDVDNCAFQLDLSTSHDVFLAGLDKQRRRVAKRGSEAGLVFVEDIDRNSLAEFYDAYCQTMEKIGEKPFPLRFFEVLRDTLGDDFRLFSLRSGDIFLGGCIALKDPLRSILHFLFLGIDYADYQQYSSEVIYVELVKWARQRGFRKCDFGGVKSDFRDGLFHLKNDFGLTPVPSFCWERGHAPLEWSVLKFGKWARSMIKRKGLA